MFSPRKWMFLALVLMFICLAPLRSAHAYIDPGTGNYLLQLIVAALFGAIFALKVFWTKIKTAMKSIQTLLFKGKRDQIEQ